MNVTDENVEASPPSPAVAVKPLEWTAYNEGFGHGRTYYGTGVFGHWYASKRERAGVWSVLHHVGKDVVHFPYFRSLDEAKAAAQADYEQHILSALVASPPSPAVAVKPEPVAYAFRLAKAIRHHDDGTREYVDFAKELKLSLTPPCVPEGSIQDYTPLYASPPSYEALREENERLKAELREFKASFSMACWLFEISREEKKTENERLKAERYELAYAITGGEDAPGLLDATPVKEIVRIARQNAASHRSDIERATTAEALLEKAREALKPFARFRTPAHLGAWTDSVGKHFSREQFEAARAALQELEGRG